MIEVKDFCKQYKPHSKNSFCVKNVSFKVEKGEIAALVGPNGSGKTTVLKAICGFHYPLSGSIIIDQTDITQEPQKAMELCGYLPEISSLPPELKVYDFLLYAAACHNLNKTEAQKRIEKLSKDFSLSEFLHNKIKNLSKGQQQRVSFAQALIHNPPNLILDEPVSGLDPAQILTLRKYIKMLGEQKTILVSTHILSEVNQLCSKAYIMHQGELHQVKNLNNIENEFIRITQEAQK
ncbi:MAG: ABC transporter ATP-binding protein [Treponema sp.]|nr:ABC transporter ATP-binding protein [Treponema sp.]